MRDCRPVAIIRGFARAWTRARRRDTAYAPRRPRSGTAGATDVSSRSPIAAGAQRAASAATAAPAIRLADGAARRRQPELRRCARLAARCGRSALRRARHARHVLSHREQHRRPRRRLETRRGRGPRARQPHDDAPVQRQFPMVAGSRARGAHAGSHSRRDAGGQPADRGGDRRHARRRSPTRAARSSWAAAPA